MPEYIEREALMLAIEESYRKNPHSDPKIRQIHNHEHRHFLCLASKQPAADVVEVKHGENITKMNPVDEFICSECGLIMRDLTEVRIDEDNEDECYFEFEFKYCPNCGVKIKERE